MVLARFLACCAVLASLASGNVRAQTTYVPQPQHSFAPTEGTQPQAVVAAADGTLYGIAAGGGQGFGTLFRSTPGGAFTVLHAFNGSDGAMQFPACCSHGALAALVLSPGGDLYGYTLTGGLPGCQSGFGCGVVFRYSTTSGFSVLWKFTGGADGSGPSALVFGSDGFLYGTTFGLPDNNGAVFKLSTTGSMTVLHSFCSAPACADGFAPQGLGEGPDHQLYGYYHGSSAPNYIYRISRSGTLTPLLPLLPALGDDWGDGAADFVAGADGAMYFTFAYDNYGSGRVDRYDIAANTLQTVHQFRYTDGGPPYRLSAGTDGALYGSAATGGRQGAGTTFRVAAGGAFTFLADLQGTLDGAQASALVQSNSGRLFGSAAAGGVGSACSGCGTLFELVAVPAGAPVITGFDPASGPVGTPLAVTGRQFTGIQAVSLGGVATGFTLQGDTQLGAPVPAGAPPLAPLALTNAAGTGYGVEPFQLSSLRYSALYAFCPGSPYPQCSAGAGPVSLLQSVDGNLYGTTAYNFPSSVLFRLTPSGTLSVLSSGLNLPNGIVESNGWFYGTSRYGGYLGQRTGCNDPEVPVGCGTVFRVNRSSGRLDVLYKFKGQADGAFPQGNLVPLGTGVFYGSTAGTLFRFQGRSVQTVHSFAAATEGSQPALLWAGQDGLLYGVNTSGGPANRGTVFRFDPALGSLTVLHAFTAAEGNAPTAGLRTAGGDVYGVTRAGGASNQGTLFRITAAGSFATVYSFPGPAQLGNAPAALRLGQDGALYGYTTSGAALGGGAVFRLATDGSGGSVLYAFFASNTASLHGYAPTSLLQGANGDWYGTTFDGGATACAYGAGCGVVFRLH